MEMIESSHTLVSRPTVVYSTRYVVMSVTMSTRYLELSGLFSPDLVLSKNGITLVSRPSVG